MKTSISKILAPLLCLICSAALFAADDTASVPPITADSASAIFAADLAHAAIAARAARTADAIPAVTPVASANAAPPDGESESVLAVIQDELNAWASEADSQAQGKSFGERLKELWLSAVIAYEKNRGLWTVVRMIALSLAVVAVMVALFKLTGHAFRKVIDRKIVYNREKWFKGIRYRNIDILSSNKMVSAVLFLSKALRYAVYALLLYIALPMIFVIFPPTRDLAGTLFSWITAPLISMGHGFIAYLPNLLRIIVIVVVTRYVLKFLSYVAAEIEAGRLVIPKFYPDWARATLNLLRIFIIAFTIVLIFPLLPESESSIFKGVSVFIGVLFSIGSSSVISNMMAGLVITYMRSFKIGDRIRVGDVFGDVAEKTLFVVRVKTVKNEVITVPNSTILAANVINYSTAASGQGVILYQTVDVSYDVIWERADRLLVEAALKTPDVLPSPPPFTLIKTLGNSAVTYQVNVYTHRPDLEARIHSDLNRNILDVLQRSGIEMITPVYEMGRDGTKSTIPEEYKSKPAGDDVKPCN
uniref:Putative transmembrane ion channel n=1 Tax=uncultured bacterium contig00093 TaxID=1181564 RepID=A0A806K149_9BACT|nr:putative transmembrane ion channel [uncultured bacterium contig00093]